MRFILQCDIAIASLCVFSYYILHGLLVHLHVHGTYIYEVLSSLHEQMERINQLFIPLCTCTHEQHTLTGRCTPRPSHSLTSANTASHQVVACVTTVGGCLSKCCSSSMINLAIGWISQIITVHSCQKEGYIIMYTD